MTRRIPVVLLSAMFILSLTSSAPAAKVDKVQFALEGEARGLELALGDQGITLGLAMSRADSTPQALGVAAGQCAVLGDSPDPDNLPCNESTTEKSSSREAAGEPGGTCASPQLPGELASVLTIEVACGSSVAELLTGKLPVTTNEGKVAEVGVGLDLSGIVPQAEDAKEQLVDQLQEIINQAPEQVRNAVDQLLESVDEGQGAQIILGPASSNVTAKGSTLSVKSTASGARIGVVGIPNIDADGNPIPGTSQATEDGLIIVEVGTATANATINKVDASSDSSSTAAIVTVKVRDITKVEPTYTEISVAPGQTVTILQGTPAESTISAAAATNKNSKGSAVAAADAVRLHLLKGVEGGLKLGLGRATAAASGSVQPAVQPRPPTRA
ncbi:MAG TPA: hypothetical protein VNP73_08805, partial [Actinomycetota bacterium]|nr:hypothetical protein [Actinomycetota bacterium]